ncbi:hypothetical protein ACQPXH_07175 [Nocardia sp. CA-135953]|uniref:hypothetical protein n=1 Tax=Nocardia sp. CA-135953 TaxID=3239978 RepID=UPI003D96C24A
MSEDTIVTPPAICGSAEIELAHEQMRRHRACRIQVCAWKWVAYYTLVAYGRIAPQTSSPRERAHRRGIEFPTAAPSSLANGSLSACGTAEFTLLHQVLNGLAEDMRVHLGDGREGERR